MRGGRCTAVAGDHILGRISICQSDAESDEETVELRSTGQPGGRPCPHMNSSQTERLPLNRNFVVASYSSRLIRGLVIAGVAAGFAVHEAVLANADFEHSLAKAAVLLALALVFGHFALCATVFGLAGSGGHISNVTLGDEMENVPLVTWVSGALCIISIAPIFDLLTAWVSNQRLYALSGSLRASWGCVLPSPGGYARGPCHIILSNDLPTGPGWSGSPRAKWGPGRE